MAEIKSTLDLVMEKTKHLKMSQAEKRALDVKETLKKVPGLVQKYVDGAMKDREFQKEVSGYYETDRDAVLKELNKQLARSFSFEDRDKDLRIIEAMRKLNPDRDEIVDELQNCIEKFHKVREELIEAKTSHFLKELEERGIRGSAIVPKAILRQEDIGRLQAIKATCLNLVSRLV